MKINPENSKNTSTILTEETIQNIEKELFDI